MIFIGALFSAAGAIWASVEQSKSESELKKKSEEISKLNVKIANTVTGGDSYSYLVPTRYSGTPTVGPFTLVHQGEFPLYDLSLQIVDLDEADAARLHNNGQLTIEAGRTNHNIGNLSPNSVLLSDIAIPQRDYLRYNIFFIARNGQFFENLRIQKVGIEYKVALRVFVGTEKSAPIFQLVDEGYPLENGNVNW